MWVVKVIPEVRASWVVLALVEVSVIADHLDTLVAEVKLVLLVVKDVLDSLVVKHLLVVKVS